MSHLSHVSQTIAEARETGGDPRIKVALARLDETVATYDRKCGVERPHFYVEVAKVVQRRMVPNFKKSFERAVRTVRR